jgi:hypothetical protein
MLKRAKVISAVTVTLMLAILAANVLGDSPKNTFLPTTGRWDVKTNWSRGRVPTNDDYAYIPSDKTVTVTDLRGFNNNQNLTGSIGIYGTVRGTSVTFDAKKIYIGRDGKIMAHDVTLNADRLEIKGKIELPETPHTDGGNITINAITVLVRETADLKASHSGDKGGSIFISATTILVEPYAKIIAGSSKEDGIGYTRLIGAKWISTSKRSDIKNGDGTKPKPDAPKVIETVMGPIPAGGRALISLPATPLIDPESIDGEITIDDIVDEGAQLYSTDLVGPGLSYPITIFAKQDEEFLYMGIEIDDLPFGSWEEFLNAGAREVYVAFDVNQDGEQFTAGDNILIFDLCEETIMDGFYRHDFQFAPDTDVGGTHDVVGAAYLFLPFGADNATLSVEFLVPLDSGDRIGADPALGPGDEIDIKIGLVFDTFELETQEHLILIIL